jgi:hypothetical protein
VLLWWMACEPEIASQFTLELQPRVPDVSAPFAGNPEVTLVIRDQTDAPRLFDLGPWSGSALQLPEVPPLDEAMVGVLLQSSGGDGAVYDPARAVAWGEAGPVSVALDTEPTSLQFVLPMVGRTALLDNLDTDERAMFTAAAMAPSGEVFRFGGNSGYGSNRPGNALGQRLDDLDDGDWAMHEAGGAPDYGDDGAPDELVGATATPFAVDNEVYVVVAGGRTNYNNFASNTKGLAVYKPANHTWVQAGRDLSTARSQHTAIPMSATGNVLLIGGLRAAGDLGSCVDASRRFPCTSFEIFDAEDWTTNQFVTDFPVATIGFAATDIGSVGVLACGGGDFWKSGIDQYTTASDPCAIIGPNGDVTLAAPLPVPLQSFAMSTLADGRVLATGGTTEACHYDDTCFATDGAWIYDPSSDAWSEAPGKLHAPRQQHVQLTMADGRVLIVGGAGGGGPMIPEVVDVAQCNEVFDPIQGTFSVLEPCDAPPIGIDPRVSGDAAHGWVVFEGGQADGTGGSWYGIIGGSPPIR